MLREIRPTIVLVIALTLITGVVYPFAISGMPRSPSPTRRRAASWSATAWWLDPP
jgi:hypothetical protein